MKIVLLGSRDWSVYAVVDDSNSNDDTCELLDFFETLAAQHHGSRDGMFQLFERFAERGRSIFNDAICHYVDQEEKILSLSRVIFGFFGFMPDTTKPSYVLMDS